MARADTDNNGVSLSVGLSGLGLPYLARRHSYTISSTRSIRSSTSSTRFSTSFTRSSTSFTMSSNRSMRYSTRSPDIRIGLPYILFCWNLLVFVDICW